MAKKKAKKAGGTVWDQAWQISLDVVKPKRILECPKCGRRTVAEVIPGGLAPFCVKCLDRLFEAIGLQRMLDRGPAPEPKKEKTVHTWSDTLPSAVGKLVTKKGRKPRRKIPGLPLGMMGSRKLDL